jgi:hypothetical protein
MSWKTCAGVLGVMMALALMAGCGAAPAASQAYRYGDMFTTEDEESYGGGGGGDYARSASPPPRTAPPPPSPSYGAPAADVDEVAVRRERVSLEMSDDAESYADEMDTSDEGMRNQGYRQEPPEEAARPVVQAPGQPAPEPQPATTPGDPSHQPERVDSQTRQAPLLIYQADLRLAVRDVQEKIDEVLDYTHEIGGYVLRQDDTSVVVRVPARRFRESLERIESLGDVLARNVSAQDVSDQVRDVQIRLRNAIQMRDRLAELLARAQTVPESLTIERELERLTEMIELMRGQLAALQERIAFSTVTVQFQPIRDDAEVPRERFRLPFPWLDRIGLPNLMNLR